MVGTNVKENVTELSPRETQEAHGNLEAEKDKPQDKCDEVIPLQHLPTEPKQKSSLNEPLVLKLKPLLDHLEYDFLGENHTLLVIIAKSHINTEKGKHMEVLGQHKLAFRWIIANIRW